MAAVSLSAGIVLAAPAEKMTVGDLAVRLARAVGVGLPPGNPQASAAAFLRSRGVFFGDDLDRAAVGGDLLDVARAVGASVTTREPAAAVTPAQGAAFVGAVRGSLLSSGMVAGTTANGAVKDDGIKASCQGREARDRRRGTPASPADPNATAPPCVDVHP